MFPTHRKSAGGIDGERQWQELPDGRVELFEYRYDENDPYCGHAWLRVPDDQHPPRGLYEDANREHHWEKAGFAIRRWGF